MILDELNKELREKRNKLNQYVGSYNALHENISQLETTINDLTETVVSTEKAIWVLQTYADFQQKEITGKIEDIVTAGLVAVFQDNSMKFNLHYSETKGGDKKKTPEVTMSITFDHDGEEVKGDIQDSFGGGLAVVAATLLRIVVTWFLSGRVRPILFLDEPLKDLSPEYGGQNSIASGYRDRMSDFLRRITQETNIQIIMVSHEPNYRSSADVNYFFDGGIGKEAIVTKKINSGMLETEDM